MVCWRGTEQTVSGTIGATRSHRLVVTRNLMEVAGTDQGKAREYVPDILEWRIDVERLVIDPSMAETVHVGVADEVTDLQDGTEVNVCIQIGWDFFKGKALISQVGVTGPLRGKETARAVLRGTGGLTRITADAGSFGRRFAYVFGTLFEE